jgi:putative DNA primase/helicase
LNRAKRQLQAYAKRKEEQEPRIRIKDQDDELWIDLGNSDWSGVRVNAEDWWVEPIIRAPLVRGDGMRPLPVPARDGDIRELRQFVNVRDDDDFTLLCGSLSTILNPFGSYHTFLISGPPNSAKTSITRAIRALTDPHEVDTRRVATIRDLQHGAGVLWRRLG